MGQVRKAARGLRWGLDRDDLEAEGRLALVEALERYDAARGPFSACAYYAIQNRLLELTRTSGHAAVAARSRPERKLRYHLGRKLAEYECQGFSTGRAIELAAHDLGVSAEHAAAALAVRSSESASVTPSDSDEKHGLQLVADGPDVSEHLDVDRVRCVLADCAAGLDERERRVLTATMLPDRPVALDALAAELGVTRRRVRQIRDETMEHMRLELKRRGLELSDLLAG